MTTSLNHTAALFETSDEDLVASALAGDAAAFGRLVERHQALVCSLALGACGDLHRSEDIAQETFVAAWGQLRELREPAKFKAWVCGIVRNMANNSLRKHGRSPVALAEEFSGAGIDEDESPSPAEHVIDSEERAILLRQLQELPPQYREPMVLFYRQNESVASVAETLGISEDAVKQRLSRGRAMLAERVERSLGSALKASVPTAAFTLAVMGALAASTTTASAAASTGAVTKASLGASAGGVAAPLLALAGTSAGLWTMARAQTENAQSPDERRFAGRMWIRMTVVSLLVGLMVGLAAAMNPSWALLLCVITPVVVVLASWRLGVWMCRRRETMRLENGNPLNGSAVTWRLEPGMPEFRKTILGMIVAAGCFPMFCLGMVDLVTGDVPRWMIGTFIVTCMGITLLFARLVSIRPASHRWLLLGHFGSLSALTLLLAWLLARFWKESGVWGERQAEFALLVMTCLLLAGITLAWGAYSLRAAKQSK